LVLLSRFLTKNQILTCRHRKSKLMLTDSFNEIRIWEIIDPHNLLYRSRSYEILGVFL